MSDAGTNDDLTHPPMCERKNCHKRATWWGFLEGCALKPTSICEEHATDHIARAMDLSLQGQLDIIGRANFAMYKRQYIGDE